MALAMLSGHSYVVSSDALVHLEADRRVSPPRIHYGCIRHHGIVYHCLSFNPGILGSVSIV